MNHKAIDYYKINKYTRDGLSEEDTHFFYKLKKQVLRHCEAGNSRKTVQAKIGYEVLGPILYGYSHWLHEQVIRTKADALLFLSREGKILERAYRALFEGQQEGNDQNIKEPRIEYINVSRLSLSKATICECSSWTELQDKYTTLFRGLSNIGELFELLGLTVSNDAYESYGLSSNLSVEKISDKEKILRLIQECGKESLKEQHDLAVRYLESKGIGNGKTIISDIGWSGTMQMLLEDLFPAEKFIGCYIAVGDIYKSGRYQMLDRRGFWFKEDDHDRWQMIRFAESAFESLFICNEGSTVGYEVRKGNIIPQKKTERNDTGSIDALHSAAINFVRDIRIDEDIMNYNKDIWFIPYMNFAIYPNRDTIEIFRDMYFIDASKEYGILPKYNIVYYMLHPRKLLKELSLNNAKTIWLYGLFHLPLPYFKILCFLTGKIGLKSNYERKYLVKKK